MQIFDKRHYACSSRQYNDRYRYNFVFHQRCTKNNNRSKAIVANDTYWLIFEGLSKVEMLDESEN